MENLFNILRTRRQHNSAGEHEFIERFIAPLAPEVMMNDKGEMLAYVVTVNPHKGNQPPILWSCHIDSVHRTNPHITEQNIYVDDNTGSVFVDSTADCLGADDGAGVWLLLEMIKANVYGTYIFHRGEEIGCWGSRGMATHHKAWLEQFTHAIAFDRRGTTSIITHQRGERACSDALGGQLADLLNTYNMAMELDPTGVYTDTAEYMDIIPECVNVSIGYENEHSDFETLDIIYLDRLRNAMISVDWANAYLPVKRDPKVREYRSYGSSWDFGSFKPSKFGGSKMDTGSLTAGAVPEIDQLYQSSMREIENWVALTDPEDVAWLIADLSDKIADLNYQIEDMSDINWKH